MIYSIQNQSDLTIIGISLNEKIDIMTFVTIYIGRGNIRS